jgi:Uncharacterized conserved protein
MKARDKARVAVLRLVNADIKRVEVDERRGLSDEDVRSILSKMVKQRRDSIEQFEKAERIDLADKEKYEISVIEEFLPTQLSEAELTDLLDRIITDENIEGPKGIGAVMSMLKENYANQVDMALASRIVKDKLN